MPWKFNDDIPIYLQIMTQFKEQIAAGTLKAGDKLDSVRELALEAGVNPNTMQKALSELEREGYVFSQRTSGRYVADNAGDELKHEMMNGYIEDFIANMRKMGYSAKETIELLNEYVSRENGGE